MDIITYPCPNHIAGVANLCESKRSLYVMMFNHLTEYCYALVYTLVLNYTYSFGIRNVFIIIIISIIAVKWQHEISECAHSLMS